MRKHILTHMAQILAWLLYYGRKAEHSYSNTGRQTRDKTKPNGESIQHST